MARAFPLGNAAEYQSNVARAKQESDGDGGNGCECKVVHLAPLSDQLQLDRVEKRTRGHRYGGDQEGDASRNHADRGNGHFSDVFPRIPHGAVAYHTAHATGNRRQRTPRRKARPRKE